jgi:hypothetical protein
MSPVSPIAHILAVAAGVWGGFWMMGEVSPDLPESDTQPGLSATAPGTVKGDDPGSLLRTGPLTGALAQLSDQVGAGDTIVYLRLDPGNLRARSGDGGLDVEEIPASAPEAIVRAIAAGRPGVTLADVAYMELRASGDEPEWNVQLDVAQPPVAYRASLDGSSAEPRG